ncbi:RNA repair transcriptional activator RtcR [Propionivibrio sp.]|uniref:RNA repair transcriptional activator RtcR n=1 Tax=Propionivibrio sp. TaxID=2212460 RepID=UPI003BF33DEB
MKKRNVVFGVMDPFWDANIDHPSTGFWRPTVSAVSVLEFPVDRFELLIQNSINPEFANEVMAAMKVASPTSTIIPHFHQYNDLWDFEEVFAYLHDEVADYPFDPDEEDYFVHMSTGTHVMRICLFLMAESRFLPGKMLQTYPAGTYEGKERKEGGIRIIDLDLSRYDLLAKRFAARQEQGASFLKSGIATRNAAFNQLIDEIEQVAIASNHPILLTGPTGAGKSLLAQRIYELKHQRYQAAGLFVPVNCATLKGEGAMSALFGHRKGAFTGAISDRTGLLKRAQGGLLFLDEVGELGAEEQAMLLRALEIGRFYPVGADQEEESRFQLISGTNKDLMQEVRAGTFREDLLARINLWTYRLPGLKERMEDIEPNLDYELDKYAQANGKQVSFNREARKQYLDFATSAEAIWRGNFRELNASVTRAATLAPGGRITPAVVQREISRLMSMWAYEKPSRCIDTLEEFFTPEHLESIDQFDRAQLATVIAACRQSRTIAEAGRTLFQASRQRRSSVNDSDRVRKYLARFGLDWQRVTT